MMIIIEMNGEYETVMKKILRPFGLLLLLILVCSAIVRVMSGAETLSDYAEKNPQLAYATPKASPSPTESKEAVPSEDADSSSTEAVSSKNTTPSPKDAVPSASPAPFSPLEQESADSIHYADGFFYQPLTDSVIARITGISYPVSQSLAPALSLDAVNVLPDADMNTLAVSYDKLRYMNVLYYDFNGEVQAGELICHLDIAQDLIEIFHELYLAEYQIESIRLIDEYGGDDTASMEANNTSCFNYRTVDNTASLSKHALGCAVDINPLYNPYVVFPKNGIGEAYISPAGSEIYADRTQDFPYKIDENDLCYQLFKAHGFTWGGDWNSCKDYQHFQKVIS